MQSPQLSLLAVCGRRITYDEKSYKDRVVLNSKLESLTRRVLWRASVNQKVNFKEAESGAMRVPLSANMYYTVN